ncbi:hypothetical protein [Paenibacillus alba]|uniref:Uncharacterized protein n=1 Tax=Paenibacillus alba TaxID=1197127 RepID=A0ABU6G563_9BACL|nr:hypothetical protein [Paenibacillus alba]MEC0227919.1 hypothetical protein [Paenibacillus alba]
MNKKIIVTAGCIMVVSILSTAVAFAKVDPSEKIKALESEFSSKVKKFYEMPNKTQEEADAVVVEGKKIKQLDIEKEALRRETDPDDEAHFLNSLESYILGLSTGVVELKERAEREQNPEFLKQAEKIEQKKSKFEKEKKAYLNKEKTVKQLRKELDLPVN